MSCTFYILSLTFASLCLSPRDHIQPRTLDQSRTWLIRFALLYNSQGKDSGVEGFPLRSWSIEIYLLNENGEQVSANLFDKVVYRLHPSFGERANQSIPTRKREREKNQLANLWFWQLWGIRRSASRKKDGASLICKSACMQTRSIPSHTTSTFSRIGMSRNMSSYDPPSLWSLKVLSNWTWWMDRTSKTPSMPLSTSCGNQALFPGMRTAQRPSAAPRAKRARRRRRRLREMWASFSQ